MNIYLPSFRLTIFEVQEATSILHQRTVREKTHRNLAYLTSCRTWPRPCTRPSPAARPRSPSSCPRSSPRRRGTCRRTPSAWSARAGTRRARRSHPSNRRSGRSGAPGRCPARSCCLRNGWVMVRLIQVSAVLFNLSLETKTTEWKKRKKNNSAQCSVLRWIL